MHTLHILCVFRISCVFLFVFLPVQYLLFVGIVWHPRTPPPPRPPSLAYPHYNCLECTSIPKNPALYCTNCTLYTEPPAPPPLKSKFAHDHLRDDLLLWPMRFFFGCHHTGNWCHSLLFPFFSSFTFLESAVPLSVILYPLAALCVGHLFVRWARRRWWHTSVAVAKLEVDRETNQIAQNAELAREQLLTHRHPTQ